MAEPAAPAEHHPYLARPHRTFAALTAPVLVSLIAEPLTGLVDTAFVARLGAAPVAALGVATALLSGTFWVFNFLGIGTQTEVARADGAGRSEAAREAVGLALALAGVLGLALGAAVFAAAEPAVRALGAEGPVETAAALYLRIRLLGAPAVLATLAGFGALRGLQDMRSPLYVALGMNALNLALDPLLIFGAGPVPALGIAGAAWASTIAHWLGLLAVLARVRRRPGLPARVRWRDAGRLLVVGRDLVARTGLLLTFLLLATRAANRAGAEAGAAHQAIRAVWTFTAFLLDAFAITAQSLVGYFRGAGLPAEARHVAGVACVWGLAAGTLLAAALLLGEAGVAALLVPATARAAFASAWPIAIWALPANALAFATDGIHWGTGDYRFLRNAMGLATGLGAVALAALDPAAPGALHAVWAVTFGWIGVRAACGVARVWPGFGRAPLRAQPAPTQVL